MTVDLLGRLLCMYDLYSCYSFYILKNFQKEVLSSMCFLYVLHIVSSDHQSRPVTEICESFCSPLFCTSNESKERNVLLVKTI